MSPALPPEVKSASSNFCVRPRAVGPSRVGVEKCAVLRRLPHNRCAGGTSLRACGRPGRWIACATSAPFSRSVDPMALIASRMRAASSPKAHSRGPERWPYRVAGSARASSLDGGCGFGLGRTAALVRGLGGRSRPRPAFFGVALRHAAGSLTGPVYARPIPGRTATRAPAALDGAGTFDCPSRFPVSHAWEHLSQMSNDPHILGHPVVLRPCDQAPNVHLSQP